MSRLPRIAFATSEVWPFVQGGGLGRAVWACARLLAPHAEVTIVTSDRFRERHAELVAADDPRLPAGVRFAFAAEPDHEDPAPYRSWHHKWSAALLDGIVAAYPDGMPDLIELPDYLAEGAVAGEAKRTGDPRLRDTLVLNRVHTTFEVAATLNRAPDEPGAGVLRALERDALRSADRLLWPGGDVLGAYQRFYGAANLARAEQLDLAFTLDDDDEAARVPPDGPLRLLYFGRLEWRKGVHNLVQAVRELDQLDLRLTLLGGDTPTAPGGGSLRAHLDELAAGDERITFHDGVPQERIGEFVRRHHLIVAPSLWESWSNVVREALMYNRPVLATPVGAMTDVVEPGRSGWLTPDTGLRSLRSAIAQVARERDALEQLIREGEPRAVLEATLDPERIVAGYLRLAREAPSRRATSAPPLPTVVVGCARADRTRLAATLASIARQTLPARVVLVLEAGAALPALGELEHLSELVELPPGSDFRARARRAGLRRARGAAVSFLEPGDVLEPLFLERAARGLDDGAAYVTSLAPLVPAPLGNAVMDQAGEPAALALYRRDALDFELPAAPADGHEDHALLAELASPRPLRHGRARAADPRNRSAPQARRRLARAAAAA